LIDRLKARGVTCIYVSHRMPEVFKLCDTVTVLRDGRHVATRPTMELTEQDIVSMMIGRPLAEYFPRHGSAATNDELLRVERISLRGKFEDVSFTLRAGEIVGLAGLVGAGRSNVAAALFGIQPPSSGKIFVRGREMRINSPRLAIAAGIGLVPEDRKRQGLVGSESGLHNASVAILDRLSTLTFVRRDEERATIDALFDRLQLKTASRNVVVGGLSGGNQQKVVIARWLAAQSKILILDEPTRGVDVGAKAEIHALVGELAVNGAAVLLISSELPEILTLSDRILVLRAGKLVGEISRSAATQDKLLRLMAGLS
jgi:ribose transport system ATP-binding protein